MPDIKTLPDAEVPPSPSSRPPPVNRNWTETILSVFAVIISAISLWIAIDTEDTNCQLVADAAYCR
jgi:hypothetical protein